MSEEGGRKSSNGCVVYGQNIRVLDGGEKKGILSVAGLCMRVIARFVDHTGFAGLPFLF